MKKKIQYQAVDVQSLELQELVHQWEPGAQLVVGVDVAKHKFLAALSDSKGENRRIVRFEHPRQTLAFVELLDGLSKAGLAVEVVMEPTGTYGDALRFQLELRRIPVFRVNNKHVHDAAELFDRSASKHDAKDACVIAWLHSNQRSARWEVLSQERRRIRALVAQRELFDVPARRLVAQMEPLLARHFPELEKFFDLSRRKTPYRLLEKFGSAAAIAAAGTESVRAFLQKASCRAPDQDMVRDLMQAARTTSGGELVDDELQLVQMMASEILRLFKMREQVDARLAQVGDEISEVKAMRPFLGAVTAAVVFAYLGAPNDYGSAAALEKAAGLNLIERSSGVNAGTKHVSKRGAAPVRKYLFMAAMRLIQSDPIVKAWYQARTSFRSGAKMKAVIAVERKLCRALFHVAAGKDFDASKLFDTRRLKVEAVSPHFGGHMN
jgi:transposase